MTKAAHTPGPWHTASTPDGTRGAIYRANPNPNFPLATVLAIGNDREERANARLIAAAPDMLALLQQYSELNTGLSGAEYMRRKVALDEQAAALIAKARGEG